MSTVIINYGMGNLASVSKTLKKIGVEHIISEDPVVVKAAEKLVLPGVGSFKAAMENLNKSGLSEAIHESVSAGAKMIGICLGMQLLASTGFEPERCSGLGLIPGEVVPLDCGLPVPHMGWNNIRIVNPQYFNKLSYQDFYFVHSYHFITEKPEHVAATVEYGTEITAAVQNGSVFGCQFHPEKSQLAGLQVLRNFFAMHA
ncbi:MAG: imidazole glycerol phosphate synthase subunit HisH [Bacteroidota bacterium]